MNALFVRVVKPVGFVVSHALMEVLRDDMARISKTIDVALEARTLNDGERNRLLAEAQLRAADLADAMRRLFPNLEA